MKTVTKRILAILLSVTVLVSYLLMPAEQTQTFAADSVLHPLNLWNADGSHGSGSMTVWKNASTSVSAPQVIYGWFGEPADSYSLFCIDYGKAANAGNSYETSTDYSKLNEFQKYYIGYVLGCAERVQAPRNNGSFNDYGGDVTFDNWKLYNSTQLMIWYYIDKYYTPGMNEGIGWDGVVKTCEAGWGNLAECERIKNIVDNLFVRPSFTSGLEQTAPTYKLTYNPSTGKYETILQDTNDTCSIGKFSWSGSGLTFTRCNASGAADENGTYLKISSDSEIASGSVLVTSNQYVASTGNITYVKNTSAAQDLILCNSSRPDPVHAYFNLTSENYTASIQVNKSSALPAINNDKTTMAGAVYGVYTTKTAAENADTGYQSSSDAQSGARREGAVGVITIERNSNGSGKITNLPIGIYYVKEVYAPSGWTLDREVYKADASVRNTSTQVTTVTLSSRETPEYGMIYVGKSRKANPLYGGSFGISTAGSMAGAEYGVFTTKEAAQAAQIKQYDDSSAYTDQRKTTITIEYDSSHIILGGPDMSSYDAYGVSEELPKGTYYVVETKAPQGWLRDKTIYQKSTNTKSANNNGIYYTVVGSQEEEQTGTIELYKTDAYGSDKVADATLEGAVYGLYTFNGSSAHTKIDGVQIVTDETGYGYVEGVPQGTYYVKEEIPAPGYQLDPNEYEVTVTADMVAGVTPAPKVESKETPILTDYVIHKYTVEDSTGPTEPMPLAGCSFAMYLKSQLDTSQLDYDEEGNLQLRLTYNEDGSVNTQGSVLEGVDPYYTAETDADGIALFKDCYMGSYIVVETKVGSREDGEYQAISPYEVKLPQKDNNAEYMNQVVENLEDAYKPRAVAIEKVDEAGNRISGAVLGIALADAKGPAKNTDGSYKLLQIAKLGSDGEPLKDSNGKYVMMDAKWTSDQELHIADYIPNGSYYLVEISAPTGYAIAEPVAFAITNGMETEEIDGKLIVKSLTMTDKVIRGNFRLVKTSLQIPNKRLQGATFSLYRTFDDSEMADEYLGDYTTDENGEIYIENLVYGKYYLKEIDANEYYYLNSDTCEFEIRKDGETVIKNYVNVAVAGRIIVHYENQKSRGQRVVGYPQTGDAMQLEWILIAGITSCFLGFLCMKTVIRKCRRKVSNVHGEHF